MNTVRPNIAGCATRTISASTVGNRVSVKTAAERVCASTTSYAISVSIAVVLVCANTAVYGASAAIAVVPASVSTVGVAMRVACVPVTERSPNIVIVLGIGGWFKS